MPRSVTVGCGKCHAMCLVMVVFEIKSPNGMIVEPYSVVSPSVCLMLMRFPLHCLHRAQRWSLHHDLQMFERALRRTSPSTAGSSTPSTHSTPHPFTPHLEWSLLPLAKIVRCLHGLELPALQAALSPLAPAFGMDAVERAIRMGGEREIAKKSEGDAGTIAGGCWEQYVQHHILRLVLIL